MGNLFDYVEQYGNQTIQEKELTEVDIIIFSQLCYIDYSKVIPELTVEKRTLHSVAEALKENNYSNILGLLVPDTILPLLYAMSSKKRYKDLLFSNYEEIINKNEVIQFCAMTIIINETLKCVVFSGTNDTIVGWKENFNLLNLKTIPSQTKSKEYLSNASKGYKGNIIVAGHSKGGNLAFYSVIHANRFTKKKVIKVFSFDGPGLSHTDNKKMQNSIYYEKFVSYITECSVVGKLFENRAETIICKSINNGLMQHDSFSWVVDNDEFSKSTTQAIESQSIEKTIKEIIDAMNEKDRHEFVNVLFKVISYSSVDNLMDMKLQQKFSVVKGYFKIEQEDRKVLNRVGLKMFKDKYLRRVFISCIMDFLKKKPYKLEKDNLKEKQIKE